METEREAKDWLAVELACARATQKDIAAIEKLAAVLDGEFTLHDYSETVGQTHALIIEAAHNPYLAALMTPLQWWPRRTLYHGVVYGVLYQVRPTDPVPDSKPDPANGQAANN